MEGQSWFAHSPFFILVLKWVGGQLTQHDVFVKVGNCLSFWIELNFRGDNCFISLKGLNKLDYRTTVLISGRQRKVWQLNILRRNLNLGWKFWGENFFWLKIFLGENFCDENLFLVKIFWVEFFFWNFFRWKYFGWKFFW